MYLFVDFGWEFVEDVAREYGHQDLAQLSHKVRYFAMVDLAAALEHDSEHTIAQGVVKTAEELSLAIPPASGFQAIPGLGVQAVVGGRQLSRRSGATP